MTNAETPTPSIYDVHPDRGSIRDSARHALQQTNVKVTETAQRATASLPQPVRDLATKANTATEPVRVQIRRYRVNISISAGALLLVVLVGRWVRGR